MLELHRLAERLRQDRRLVLVDEYEIAVERLERRLCSWRNGAPFRDAKEVSYWAGLRVLHRKRPGRAATASVTDPALDALVSDALAAAEGSHVDPWFRFPIWRKSSPRAEAVAEISSPESVFRTVELAPDVVDETFIEATRTLVLYRKSERFPMEDRVVYRTGAFAVRHRVADAGAEPIALSEDFLWESETERSRRLRELCVETLVAEGANRGVGVAESSLCLGPAAVAFLLDKLGADFSDRGEFSLLLEDGADAKGAPLSFSPVFTLEDDGTKATERGGGIVDWEGSATQRTPLVMDGKPVDALRDAHGSARQNRRSTGNRLRGPGQLWPAVGSNFLVLRPGTSPTAALRKGVGDGYLVQRLREVVQDDHVRWLASGWRVASGGKLTEPFRDAVFPQDAIALLRRTSTVGADARAFARCTAPSIVLAAVPETSSGASSS